MGKRYFGTDGIRGVAGQFPLDRPTVHAFGRALGRVLGARHGGGRVVLGMDTRESSPWIAEEVAGGLAAESVPVDSAGVTTTPGVAFLTHTGPYEAGVMISASHNPYRDNGLKVFGHSGYKLPDDEEHEIEEEMDRLRADGGGAPLRLTEQDRLDRTYIDHLLSTLETQLDGLRIVLDCGNGAASHLAPELFRRVGAEVAAIHASPDGRNINNGCGALHVEDLQAQVVAHGADLGVAFDGDADRAIFVAGSGKVVNGDAVLLIAARHLAAAGNLPGRRVVATVMSNFGLEQALAAEDIGMVRTPVGDKYVLEEMLRTGAALGGEQSGHVIFLKHATTGDGMLTALRIAEIVRQSGESLEVLASGLQVFPQRLVNIRVREKRAIGEMPEVAEEIRECERALEGSGRVLVRFSGTEPLARVMVEAADASQVDHYCARIAGAIERAIG